MDSFKDRQDKLRQRLRAQSNRLDPRLQRLGDALWNTNDDALSHEACIEMLPEFVDAEVARQSVAQLFPAVKHHLDRCDTCAQEYAELLEAEWAEQRGALMKPQNIPRPDLSFLPKITPQPSLQEMVLERTRALLPLLAPAHLRELAVIADTFFARVQQLGTFELRLGAAQALGLGQRDTNPALTFLAASYVATQTLLNQITRAQFDQWSHQGTLQQELETRAVTAARAIGIERETAARFARAYTQQIIQAPASLRAQLTDK